MDRETGFSTAETRFLFYFPYRRFDEMEHILGRRYTLSFKGLGLPIKQNAHCPPLLQPMPIVGRGRVFNDGCIALHSDDPSLPDKVWGQIV
jgi:hypothetical protein